MKVIISPGLTSCVLLSGKAVINRVQIWAAVLCKNLSGWIAGLYTESLTFDARCMVVGVAGFASEAVKSGGVPLTCSRGKSAGDVTQPDETVGFFCESQSRRLLDRLSPAQILELFRLATDYHSLTGFATALYHPLLHLQPREPVSWRTRKKRP